MNKLLATPLFYIYLIYGLSFLAMAWRIAGGMKKATSIALVSSFSMLVFFGIAHGTAELVDWIRFIIQTLGNPDNIALLYTSQILMVISFVVLLQFGVNLMSYKSKKKGVVRTIPAACVLIFVVALFVSGISDIQRIGLAGRHSFGLIGSTLSGVLFFRLGITVKTLGDRKLVNGLNLAAIGFAAYAVFGGLIVQPIFGLPVQLFRAACAVTILVASSFIRGVFKIE